MKYADIQLFQSDFIGQHIRTYPYDMVDSKGG